MLLPHLQSSVMQKCAFQPSISRAVILVAFSFFVFVAAAVAGTLAAPAADAYGPAPRSAHVISPQDDTPDFEFGSNKLARRQDYNQNYKTDGNVNFSPTSNGYSVTFSGAGDFVVWGGGRGGAGGGRRRAREPGGRAV